MHTSTAITVAASASSQLRNAVLPFIVLLRGQQRGFLAACNRFRGLCRCGFRLGFLCGSRQRQCLRVGSAPKIPARHTAIWLPLLTVGRQLFRLGELLELAHLRETLADSVVIDREYVGTTEPEDEQ